MESVYYSAGGSGGTGRKIVSIIDIENLRYDYVRAAEEGNVTVSAIRGIDLSVEPGSFTAVIGRNGSGKSTRRRT